jgi:23S rRNA pseudouridine2605 synthase
MNNEKMRLAKLIAISGQASRRQAEQLILDEKVNVNGEVIKDVVTFVTMGNIIKVNNVDISAWLSSDFTLKKTKLWLYYKPYEIITSRKDPQGRTTIFSLLPQDMQNVLTIGRLDYNTEGLILLTNNGELSRFFELPANNIKRIYRCRVHGCKIGRKEIYEAKNGLNIDGMQYKEVLIEPHYISYRENFTTNSANQWFNIILSEGKNREIRRIFEYFGAKVSRLIRIGYGEFSLGNMLPQQLIPVDNRLLRKYTKKISTGI